MLQADNSVMTLLVSTGHISLPVLRLGTIALDKFPQIELWVITSGKSKGSTGSLSHAALSLV